MTGERPSPCPSVRKFLKLPSGLEEMGFCPPHPHTPLGLERLPPHTRSLLGCTLSFKTISSLLPHRYLAVLVDNRAVVDSITLHARGSVVLDSCYTTMTTVTANDPNTNGWSGLIELSRDGGVSYQPATCTNCVTGSESDAAIDFDGDSTSQSAPARCVGGALCNLAFPANTTQSGPDCLRINTTNEGYMSVMVDGFALTDSSTMHPDSTVLVDSCFPSITTIIGRNVETNGWAGTYEVSTDGGSTYVTALCTNCAAGSGTAEITFDGNSDDEAIAQCSNGAACQMVIPASPSATGQFCLRVTTATTVSF